MAFEDLPNSNYPNHYDDEEISPSLSIYLPYPGDTTQIVEYIVRMRNSIISIERELGTNPSGNQATVAQRLDLIEGIQGEILGLGKTVHRIQIADKYSVNTIYDTDLCVGQIGVNIYEESGLSGDVEISELTFVEVFLKAHVYVQRNSILTLKLYNVTTTPQLITTMIFNNTNPYFGGEFTSSQKLNLVSQLPIEESTLELRVFQEEVGFTDPDKKTIVWDTSLIVETTRSKDGYGFTGRYVDPTDEDLIVWKFDDDTLDEFQNDGYVGSDGDLINSGTSHQNNICGIFEKAALLSGTDMFTREICVAPETLTISMWINPILPITPGNFGLVKLDDDENNIISMSFNLNSSITFDILGIDNSVHSFTTPVFSYNSTNDWIFVGLVFDNGNVYVSANGNYELAGTSIPDINYDGLFSAGEGKWGLITSDIIVDDIRIAEVARGESWFRNVYKLGINRYP